MRRIMGIVSSMIIIMFLLLYCHSTSTLAENFRENATIYQWQGTYKGFIDGRPAVLRISYSDGLLLSAPCVNNLYGDEFIGRPFFSVTLRELDRGVIWVARCIRAFTDLAPHEHIWNNFKLREVKTNVPRTTTLYDAMSDVNVNEGPIRDMGELYL